MRDHSMFDFLVGDTSVKTVDLELVKEFAKQAASAHLGQNKDSLNNTITKIASIEKLNPDQVYLVCQEANKIVNTELFKTASDKYTDFELADAAKILLTLEGSEKTASAIDIDQDYNLAPGEVKAYCTDFSFSKTAGHAGLNDNSRREQRSQIEKIAAEKQRLEDDVLCHRSAVELLENKFIKIARNQLLPYGLKERRGAFPYITHFCKEAGLSESRTQKLMGFLDKVMVQQGLLEKSADIKADPDLISNKLNTRIVNGTHPLYVVVKTIKDKDEEEKLYEDRGNVIREKMDIHKANGAILGTKAIREL